MEKIWLSRRSYGKWGFVFGIPAAMVLIGATALAADPAYYVRKDTWRETMRASREALSRQERREGIRVPLPNLGESDFTITAWLRTEADGGTIVSKCPRLGEWKRYGKAFFVRNGKLGCDSAYVGFMGSDTNVNDGQWHHTALTKKGEELAISVDGRLIRKGELLLEPDEPEHVMKIGYCTPDFPEEQSGFQGEIDEVRIYNRKLSPDEIKATAENSDDVTEGLAGFWNFEDGASDVSGNRNDGKIHSATRSEGKFGNAVRFDGNSSVTLPSSAPVAARREVWELIARDFTDEKPKREMEREQADNIWKADWNTGDVKELASRYTKAARDIGGLLAKISKLASGTENSADLEKVASLYHLSIFSYQSSASVRTKIKAMRDGVAYLEELHSRDDVKWQKYKSAVAALASPAFRGVTASLAHGDESAIRRLASIESDAEELRSKIPLTLPSGPKGPGRFGAYYTKLKYSLEWDRLWRVGPDADVVVRFDDGGHRFVFWRGTSYIPCWVTDAGGWYTNEFFERRGGERSGTMSMVEPMSDKQCRYSRVRIIESNDARVVVHWRYAPVDLKYHLAYIDKESGWGDWADEYYTIYPDAVGVRKAKLYTSATEDWIEYQESIVVNQPGTRPEDNLHYAAVTLANMKGDSHTYSWEHTWPDKFDKPPDGNIQVVNLKGKTRPFSIVDPDGAFARAYPKYGAKTKFHCWSHWPVSQEESDTTVATTFDRPSHTSLSHIKWKPYAEEEKSRTWVMLHGMTDRDGGELAVLAKSWLHAPQLEMVSRGFTSAGYDLTQRAYVLTCNKAGEPAPLAFRINASEDSPSVNPAFVIKRWGKIGAALKLNGRAIKRSKDFRFGHRPSDDGYDLIVWIKTESNKPLSVSLSRVGRLTWHPAGGGTRGES